MQSKGFIKLIAVLLALACVYQLSFTFKTRSVEKKAAEYAAQFPIDEQSAAEQHYLDSIQNLSVYNLGIRKFTYKECKEKELNLGLDLKGGMNVMLEVQVEDVVKALAGDSQNDPAFVEAIAEANEALKQGTSSDYIGDFVKAYSRLSNGRPIAEIFVSPDRQDITLESSDADVEKVLKQETEAAIGASFNVLRSRIDHFGVTQPNIMRLPNSHRILVELPGVKEPQRVRDLLQGTASLEFWLTYDANEVIPALVSADKLLKDELSQAAAQTEPVAEETPAAEAAATEDEGLIGEIGADSTASAEAVQTGHFDREQNPLFAVLDPNYAGGAAIGAAYKADMAAVNEYLSRPEVLELFPADILFKWGVKGDDHIDGRYYLYAIKVTTPDGKGPAGRFGRYGRPRAVCPARCHGGGLDDDECRGHAGVGPLDGREHRQVHCHRARRLCLLGPRASIRRSTRDSRRLRATSRSRRRRTWPTCSTRVRSRLRRRSSRIRLSDRRWVRSRSTPVCCRS